MNIEQLVILNLSRQNLLVTEAQVKYNQTFLGLTEEPKGYKKIFYKEYILYVEEQLYNELKAGIEKQSSEDCYAAIDSYLKRCQTL